MPVQGGNEISELIDGFNRFLRTLGRREECLKASEARFKVMFDDSPLGVALIDSLAGHTYAVNSMFAKIVGRTLEEMATIDWISITHPDDVQKDLDNMALLNARKIPGFQMEKRYIRPDGTVVWISMTVAPIQAIGEAHPRHLCIAEDITERKRMEQALQLSQAQMAASQRIGRTGSWVYSIETNEISGSAEGLRIFGYAPVASNCPIDDIEACIPERARVHQALVDLISEGRNYDLEYVINPADGSSPKAIHSIAMLEKDAQGNPVRVTGFVQDITERKQSEAALHESRNQYRDLVERTPDLVTRVDTEGRFVFVNSSSLIIYGLAPEDCIGRSAFDFIATEDRDGTIAAFQLWLESAVGLFEHENRQVRIDGGVHIMTWKIGAERDESGNIIGFASTARDVSERRQEENLIKERNAALTRQKEELEATLGRIKRLEGLLSICMQCKKIRTESNDWHQLERYIGEHSDTVFSHGLCPECLDREMKQQDLAMPADARTSVRRR